MTMNSSGAVLVTPVTLTVSAPTFLTVETIGELVDPTTVFGKVTALGGEIWPSVGGGGGGDTPQVLHLQVGLAVPSAHKTLPLLAQLLVMPP